MRPFISFRLFLFLVFAFPLAAADLDWPEITSQTKPWSRWWWLGNIGTKQDFTVQMEKYAKAGLGGLEITPIYGVRGEEKQFRDYLSPAWMELFDHVLDEGQRLHLGIDMSTGTGWPFGGPWVTPDFAARHVVTKSFTLKGGEKLAEPVVATDAPIVRVAGPRRVEIAELKDPVASNPNLQDLALDQVRFPRRAELQALVAQSATGEKINLTDRVKADGQLDWTAPAGTWTLYGVFIGWHGKQVERAGPGGEGDVIDHFSAASLGKYLKRFDDAYVGHRATRLRAYFNDSYEVDDASGESNWTPHFFDEFKKRRGYDLRHELAAFFGKDTEEKNARVMSDHRETISDLLLEEYTQPWAKWAKQHGAVIRNQAHGSPANLIDLYAASDIPETEGTNVVGMKLASSAAHITGKPLASAETATWLDEHWVSTLGDVKRRVDLMFLGGVNHNCYHGTVFSPPGETWPGHHFYAAAELDPSNAIWADFDALNAYVARCQSFLQAGKPANDVLLYYPIYDTWGQRGNGAMPHFSSGGGGGARGGAGQGSFAQDLLNRGYTFDYFTDRLLAGIKFSDGVLQSGGNRYRVIVVPETKLIPLATIEKLFALAETGATVVFHKAIPNDVPGLADLAEKRVKLQARLAPLSRTARETNGIAALKVGRGQIMVADDIEAALVRAAVPRETFAEKGLKFERRALGSGFAYFLLNPTAETVEGWFPLPLGSRGVALFDPMTAVSGIATTRAADERTEVFVRLAPGESTILKTSAATLTGASFTYWQAQRDAQPVAGEWKVKFATGGPTLPADISSNALKSWTEQKDDAYQAFAGTAIYRTTFARPAGSAAAWQLDLGKVAESARITLNGRDLGVRFTAPFILNVSNDQLQAQNTLEVAVTNLSANRIADLDRHDPSWKKFYNTNYPARIAANRGSDGNFSAAKWAPRPSGLLGPVTLTPLQPLAILP